MRIAIDARMIKLGSMHGIARYVYELIRGLAAKNSEFEYHILVNEDSPIRREVWPANIQFVIIKAGWIGFREQFEIPAVLRARRIDLRAIDPR